jgi:periplasmic protein TonB
MSGADFSTPKRTRLGLIVLIALIHVAVAFGLVRALAPGVVDTVVENVTSAVFVTVRTTPPAPPPEPTKPAPRAQGEEGIAAKQATPKAETAPAPKVVIAQKAAPRAAATGADNRSGANAAGAGTGGGDSGGGTGAGGQGSGQGGGAPTKVEKIAGDINSARDYPREGRDLRLGNSVVIAVTVGADGNAKACRVARPSPDPAADRITCDLAMARFRFRPATNSAGQPIEAVYGWQQRWFTKPRD